MPGFLDALRSRPWVAHLIQAGQRFTERLGSQFAAAITYFSVLALVPTLMVAFAVAGLTVTLVYPEALVSVKEWIHAAVSGQGTLGDQITAVVDQALSSWRSVGAVGLLSAAWAGVSWVNNLRQAVQAMVRPHHDQPVASSNLVVTTLANLGILLALFVLGAVSIALSASATAARSFLEGLLGLGNVPGGAPLLAIAPIVGSLLAGLILFTFILRVFPQTSIPLTVALRGALIGTVGMAALQYLAGTLVGAFSGNAAFAVFGSVIIVMLYFNLFATLILMVAAWVGTDPHVLTADPQPLVPAATPTDWATKKLAAELEAARMREEDEQVPVGVAVRSTRVGVGLGAVVGGSLAGIAALIATAIAGWRERG